MIRALLCAVVLAALTPQSLSAQTPGREHTGFSPTTADVSVSGEISGYETVHYIFAGAQAQSVAIALDSDHPGNYFNLFEPGKRPGEDQALFIGATEGNRYQGTLQENGNYLVQVYIIRSAARRDETARYTVGLSNLTDGR